MKILHISAECYPAAKAGGLGDVAGALPKYLSQIDLETAVIIPKYATRWITSQTYSEVFQGGIRLHLDYVPFTIEKCETEDLGFPLYVVDIPGKYDRESVYTGPDGQGFPDEMERSLCFQQAVLKWVIHMEERPSILHCHDHHTGLIPFLVKHCPEYNELSDVPTIFTIHNGMYHGAQSWDKAYLLPFFETSARGLLDWGNMINPLATGVKCCWRLTTVSETYLEELRYNSNGLEWLLQEERPKSIGILNGIDNQVWDPKKDPYITHTLKRSIPKFKTDNKKVILNKFGLKEDLPLYTFIGRLVSEKGADLLPDLIERFLSRGYQATFALLGTGDPELHQVFSDMSKVYKGYFHAALEYNEGLAHQLYAGADFLLMPSRVEPCGLNQMYAMRFGTIPVVRSVGGLKDTIPDIGEPDGSGRGFRFDHFTLDDGFWAIYRATEFYRNKKEVAKVRRRIMGIDLSWEKSAKDYLALYKSLVPSLMN